MNAYEYLNALRKALDVLPDDERANAIRYYEEYFLDAGPENEQTVIAELGTPEQVAQNILNEYTEIARTAPRQQTDGPQQAEQAETPPRGFQKDSSFVPPRQSPLLTFLAICGAERISLRIGERDNGKQKREFIEIDLQGKRSGHTAYSDFTFCSDTDEKPYFFYLQ